MVNLERCISLRFDCLQLKTLGRLVASLMRTRLFSIEPGAGFNSTMLATCLQRFSTSYLFKSSPGLPQAFLSLLLHVSALWARVSGSLLSTPQPHSSPQCTEVEQCKERSWEPHVAPTETAQSAHNVLPSSRQWSLGPSCEYVYSITKVRLSSAKRV